MASYSLIWDPLRSTDWDKAGPMPEIASTRLKKEIMELQLSPLPGIILVPYEKNFAITYALIIGPQNTPYENCLFNFVIRFGPQYPMKPPRVKFLTTNGGKARLNPNFYECGKVCVSILGTWEGPKWSPACGLSSLLLSLQSLLNEDPLYNEPGYTKMRHQSDSEIYNAIIMYEAIQVSVCKEIKLILDNRSAINTHIQEAMIGTFKWTASFFIELCEKYKYLDEEDLSMSSGYHESVKFNFKKLKETLCELKKLVKKKSEDETTSNLLSDSLGEKLKLSSSSENADVSTDEISSDDDVHEFDCQSDVDSTKPSDKTVNPDLKDGHSINTDVQEVT